MLLEFEKLVNIQAYKTTSAANKGFSGKTSTTGYRAQIMLTDYRELIKELNKVDKEIVRELKANYKEIARGVNVAIKGAIEKKPPLSGMRKVNVPGRTTWGAGKPAASTTIRQPRISKKKGAWSIAAIRVNSTGTIIADMAGKSNAVTGKTKKTASYRYTGPGNKNGFRQHRLTRQGSRMFIANLDARLGGKASRMVWPAAEQALPLARTEMIAAINDAIKKINKEMRSA